MLFSSTSSAIMLNGVPGNFFYCLRGVRQGDPLSPLLFFIAADLLQTILNETMRNGLISAPIHTNSDQDFPVIQYADDTVLVMQANAAQLHQLKNLLMYFSTYTGLRVNYEKFVIVPINTANDKMLELAHIMGCKVGSFPFTYLGLPLCLSKPKIEHFMPIMKRIERRLAGCSSLLSYGDKLLLVKSVFYSLPIFFMCTLALPSGVMEQIKKYLKHFFWRKYGMEDRGTALNAWDKVCQPKEKGGFGVLDIATHNKC